MSSKLKNGLVGPLSNKNTNGIRLNALRTLSLGYIIAINGSLDIVDSVLLWAALRLNRYMS